MSTEAAAKFPIDLEGNASEKSKELADELEKLRQRIEGGTDSLKAMQAQMRRLQQASSVDIAAARELKVKIQEQKDSIASASVQVMKLGSSYEELAAKSKKVEKGHGDLDLALKSTPPKVQELTDKFGKLGDLLTGASFLEIASVGLIALAAAVVAAGAAVVAFGVAATASLAQFVLESTNAARSANLLRLAFVGTEQNAHNLGTQVDELARKVPTAKSELNKLASELAESGLQGQALVDVFNAIGTASAAGAGKAAAKIQEIIDRSKLLGRVAINPQELLGSGLKFDEIAVALSEQMHVGIDQARLALLQGAVPLGDAAAAMRKAVETKFGKINASKMLDVGVQFEKFKENLAGLTKDINIEPLLEDLKSLFSLFSETTVTGSGIKVLVEAFGKGMVDAVHASTPVAKAFIEGLVLGGLRVYATWLRFRISLHDTFANNETLNKIKTFAEKIDLIGMAGKLGVFTMGALAGAIIGVAGSLALVVTALGAFVAAGMVALKVQYELAKGFVGVGKSITGGMLHPVKTGDGIKEAAGNFVDKLGDALNRKLEIHSPSALMRRTIGLPTGQGVIAGTIEGIERGSPDAARALENMLAPAPTTRGPSIDANAGAREINLHFHVPNKETVEAIKEPDVYATFLRMIEEALKSAGIPVKA